MYLVFLGVPAFNGSLSIYTDPVFFVWLHGFLPMPAAVESIRSILYFDADVVAQHLLTFGMRGALWLVLVSSIVKFKPVRTETALVLSQRVLTRRPTQTRHPRSSPKKRS